MRHAPLVSSDDSETKVEFAGVVGHALAHTDGTSEGICLGVSVPTGPVEEKSNGVESESDPDTCSPATESSGDPCTEDWKIEF